MLRLPMKQLTPLLPLREEIREALRGTEGHERSLLQWLEHQENGDWEGCDAVVQSLGLTQAKLLGCYAEAVVWAESALKSAV
jgi:c-di-GMP-related signal transduction protein